MMCQSAVEVDDVVVNGMLALAEFGLKLIVLAFYFFTCFLRIFFCIVLTFFFLFLSSPSYSCFTVATQRQRNFQLKEFHIDKLVPIKFNIQFAIS
jgi:hypothetical protein